MGNICIEKLSIKACRNSAPGRSRPVATPYFGSIERPLSMVAMIESDLVSQIRFRPFYTYCNPYYIIFPVLIAFFTPFTLKTFFNLIVIFHPHPINRSQNRFYCIVRHGKAFTRKDLSFTDPLTVDQLLCPISCPLGPYWPFT